MVTIPQHYRRHRVFVNHIIRTHVNNVTVNLVFSFLLRWQSSSSFICYYYYCCCCFGFPFVWLYVRPTTPFNPLIASSSVATLLPLSTPLAPSFACSLFAFLFCFTIFFVVCFLLIVRLFPLFFVVFF